MTQASSSKLERPTAEAPRPPAPRPPRRPRAERSAARRDRSEGLAEGVDWEAYTPAGAYARWGKRLLNALLLSLSLPVALALALPIALLNWLSFGDPRRILYCQPRVGRHGRVFWIWKFRTMREADDAFDSWRDGHDRARVTRFGRLLRNTHLDELPQLLNILRGEMDFIGPRPEMIEIDRWACERIAGFRLRNALLPGITGFAQITQGYAGMDERAYAEKLAADRLYCRKVSLGFDLEILARTALWMLRGRGWRWQEKKRSHPTVGEPLQAEP